MTAALLDLAALGALCVIVHGFARVSDFVIAMVSDVWEELGT